MMNFLLAWLFIKNRKILEVLSWLILMESFTKFGLLKDRCENSQMFKMWDKNLVKILKILSSQAPYAQESEEEL